VPHAPAAQCPPKVSVEPPAGQEAGEQPIPSATAVHVPGLLAMLQAWHAPQAALPQQTPSTQLPVLHWLPAAQAAPRSSLLVHDPMGRSMQ
jgi:hypothetical protein